MRWRLVALFSILAVTATLLMPLRPVPGLAGEKCPPVTAARAGNSHINGPEPTAVGEGQVPAETGAGTGEEAWNDNPPRVWYFAEGYTGADFNEWLCLFNPTEWSTTVNITYVFPDGTTLNQAVPMQAKTRGTVYVPDVVGLDKNVSMVVDAGTAPFAAERSMYFNYRGKWTGGHCVMGGTHTSNTFYFAEGYTGSDFEEWLCILNPGTAATAAHITYMFPDGTTQGQYVSIEATSRKTIYVPDVVGLDKNVSIQLIADDPVVAERPVYFNYKGAWTGGHCVMGATYPTIEWNFAEGYTGPNFEEWLCLLNPGTATTTAHITYMFPDGTTQGQDLPIEATSRKTIYVPDVVGPDKNVATRVAADNSIVAERPVYFNYKGAWTGGHCVMGAPSLSTGRYFGEGYTGSDFNEWLCISNPNPDPTQVEVHYISPEGELASKLLTIGATTRTTIYVPDVVGPDKNVSIRVTSYLATVSERSMYFNYKGIWTGGHCVVGYEPTPW